MTENLDRRRVLRTAAAAGIALPLAAACGSSSDNGSSSAGTSTTEPTTDPATEPTTDPSASPSETSDTTSGTSLGSSSDVPVGGGKIYGTEKVVVTQPTSGDFKAFSAICTHNKCLLASVSDKTINCDCHKSKFDYSTGEPVQGPNGQPASTISALPKKNVTVANGTITLDS